MRERKTKKMAQTVGLGSRLIFSLKASPPTGVRSDAGGLATPVTVSRLSSVVLPFANLSNDPEQEYFADGITDDLTTDLSRISGSFVIARTTAFTYKAKPIDVDHKIAFFRGYTGVAFVASVDRRQLTAGLSLALRARDSCAE